MKVVTSFPTIFSEQGNVYRKRLRVEFSKFEYTMYKKTAEWYRQKDAYTQLFGEPLKEGVNYSKITQHKFLVGYLSIAECEGYKRAKYSMDVNCIIEIVVK